jgi:ABC-type multidrug transport system fused ATPase/permease subunit
MAFFNFQIWGRMKVLLKARRDDGRDYSQKTWIPRLKNTLIYGLGQFKFLKGDQPAGILHIFIFWGFITLGLQVMTMFIRGWMPDFILPGLHADQLGKFYALTKDIFQVLVLISVVIFLVRWGITKPRRLYGILPAEQKLNSQSHWEPFLILSFIGGIMLSSFVYDASRAILSWNLPETQAEMAWSPFTHVFVSLIGLQNTERASLLLELGWWIHNGIIIIFMNLLPRSKHFHIITGMANVFFGRIEARGRLPKKDYAADGTIFARSKINQISWKQWGLAIPGRPLSVLHEHTVKRGDVHFILGESGAGKTTFALNLLGITHDAELEIETPQGVLSLRPELSTSWFKHLGWVPQFPQLAHGSIRDQFTLISRGVSDLEIEKILLRCALDVRDLPQGLDSIVGGAGEGTNSASGGQIRKIAVARALFSRPQVLIADEPTADLDSKSSEIVMKTLRDYAATGVIVVCITHDLSIVRSDDSRQGFETVVPS